MVTEAKGNITSPESLSQRIEGLAAQFGGWREEGTLSPRAAKKLSDETVIKLTKLGSRQSPIFNIEIGDLSFSLNKNGLCHVSLPLEIRIGEERLVSDDWPELYPPSLDFHPEHSRVEIRNRLVDWVFGMIIEDRYTPPPISLNLSKS